ncbi:transglutaminase domain-containing protein [Sediminitomix flava]|uniref:Transglutaminase superfamily protein n=1 Tax=Sediminitomix flava TaxID=379075 RepID=A0A315Z7R9_SEDFL|nr:transglutaminase domain-containing protein [Sediminitomix flava]PWJ38651.1 transglutaminase superfamily protein [Sediminitomix flava]
MKKLLLFVLILNLDLSVNAQISDKVKVIVKNYPSRFTKPEKIASKINKDFKEEVDKVGAIYFWIANNIAYDVETLYSKKNKKGVYFTYRTKEELKRKEQKYNEKLVRSVLKKKVAICDGYSRIFKSLCDLTDIECVIISGSSKTVKGDIGIYPKVEDHAWNAVKINNEWKLIDSTWGAGYVNSELFIKEYDESYFFTDPEFFFYKHYPSDAKWLLISKTKEDFANLPLYYSEYLNSDFKIESPQIGVIDSSEGDKVIFYLNSETSRKLTYAFNNDKYSTRIEIKKDKGKPYFEIPKGGRKRGYLTIYCNNKAIAVYKLKPLLKV